MKIRERGNLMKILHDYDYHDRKFSGKWVRRMKSKSHSMKKRDRNVLAKLNKER